MKKKVTVAFVVIVFFIISFLFAYFILTLLPLSYTKQRAYSTPSNEGKVTSSTMGGGEALVGIDDDESLIPPVPVFLGPRPGATDISLDTVIYVYQTRPVSVELQLDPETEIARIENKNDPPASLNTIFYPAQPLQPNTTYNVSGSIMGYSAWWTFTTTSAISQPEYELLSPYALWIAIIAASIATSVFAKIIWRPKN